MKTITKRLSLLILSLVMILSAFTSGCSFITSNNPSDDTTKTPPTEGTITKVEVNVDLKNLTEEFGDITYVGKSHEEAPYGSVAETIEKSKVNRSSVAIFVTTASGLICGSGVIVDIDDGVNNGNLEDNIFYVITCNHVVSTCEKVDADVSIYVPDAYGRNYDDVGYDKNYAFTGKVGGNIDLTKPVSLVGGDTASDIAVLRLFVSNDVLASNLVKAKIMSDEYSLKLGESVFAIGNSEGTHGGWVSSGVVADIGSIEEINTIGKMSLIGISVDSYAGNSGGGLFNLYGELVGITNAGKTVEVANGATSSVGINYAIPIKNSTDLVRDTGFVNVVKQLMATYVKSAGKNYGYIKGRPDIYWFELGLLSGKPAVFSVVEGSQADGYVQTGDVVIGYSINGGLYKEVKTYNDISDVFYTLAVGDKITISFSRAGNYGKTTTFSKEFTAKQFYFCNTGDYTNIKA